MTDGLFGLGAKMFADQSDTRLKRQECH